MFRGKLETEGPLTKKEVIDPGRLCTSSTLSLFDSEVTEVQQGEMILLVTHFGSWKGLGTCATSTELHCLLLRLLGNKVG